MRAFLAALPLVLWLGAYQSAHSEAANVSGGVSCYGGGLNGLGDLDIKIVGEIGSTTVDKVGKLFDEQHSPSVKCVVVGGSFEINSPGGDVNAAIAIGRMFRKEHAHLQVNKDSVCISACVLILAGAVDRLVSGMVGIHRPYLITTPRQPLTPDQTKVAYKRMLQEIRLYLRDMNVSERLADDMLATEPERVHILTRTELTGYGLVGVDPAEQQRIAIEREAHDVQEANKLGLDRREYTRRKALGLSSCVYNSGTGNLMTQSEMLDCRRRILTIGQ
jgi:ATP-dependent protease ClpP protease subunit